MSKKTDCKGFFSDVIASMDIKRVDKNLPPLTLEEKLIAWNVWQICWSQVRVQLRRELKQIEKSKRLTRKTVFKEETFMDKVKKAVGVSS